MKRLSFMLFCYSLFIGVTYGQNAKRANPILFYEGFGGLSEGRIGELTTGATLNYQLRQSLFTVRCSMIEKFMFDAGEHNNSIELAALYGIRYSKERSGFSLSAGISHNAFIEWYDDENSKRLKRELSYIGFPYEANIKWFKKEKKRFRIYGIIPVGRPTAFGGSIGFKLFGNISKNSYGGMGLTYGLGYHKKY